jgi:hypothetical protein
LELPRGDEEARMMWRTPGSWYQHAADRAASPVKMCAC